MVENPLFLRHWFKFFNLIPPNDLLDRIDLNKPGLIYQLLYDFFPRILLSEVLKLLWLYNIQS